MNEVFNLTRPALQTLICTYLPTLSTLSSFNYFLIACFLIYFKNKYSFSSDEAYDLDFYYEQAEDYPVDLYYLMDLSKSMEDDKEKLSALGDLLSATMQNITSNFRLGFGSFVDKVVMPYVSTVPRK